MQNKSSEGQFAPCYDLVFNPFLHRVHKKITQLARKYDCENIIDLGSGTGQQARVLAAHGFSVTGVDVSKKMVELARKKSTKSITFIHDSIESLTLKKSSFDAAILSLVLHPNTQNSIQTIIEKTIQIVKSNGKLFITDYGRGRGFSGVFANMLIKGVETCADIDHRKNYTVFMKNHGLDMISFHPQLQILEECFFFYGALQTRVYRSKKIDIAN